MQAVLQGIAQSPTTTAVSYNFVTANLNVGTWSAYNAGAGSGSVVCPVSDTITITSVTVQITTAPGTGASWAFNIYTGGFSGADAYVEAGPFGPGTISDSSTSVTWTGSITIPSGNVFSIGATPSSGTAPVSAGVTSWTITYTTPSNYYIMPQGSLNFVQGLGTEYMPPMGGENTVPTTTPANVEGVVPSAITVTRIAIMAAPCPTSSTTYTATCYKVSTSTASTFSAASSTTNVAVSATGTMAFAAGDTMCIRYVSTGSTWCRVATCLTITPGTTGEQISMFGNVQALSTTAVGYEELWGIGLNTAWSSTEAAVQSITPTCTYSKLYVLLATAPGTSKTRTFVLRMAGASTALTVALTGTATTGSDTTHTVSATTPALVDMMHTPASTPAASNGVRFGLVQVIPQPVAPTVPATQFLSMF